MKVSKGFDIFDFIITIALVITVSLLIFMGVLAVQSYNDYVEFNERPAQEAIQYENN